MNNLQSTVFADAFTENDGSAKPLWTCGEFESFSDFVENRLSMKRDSAHGTGSQGF
jgi:hypothetical protein